MGFIQTTSGQPKFNILVRAQDMDKYIFEILDTAPKKFRGTSTQNLINTSQQIVKLVYLANGYALTKDTKEEYINKRYGYQCECLASLQCLTNYLEVAKERKCINESQYGVAMGKTCNTIECVTNWVASDRKRLEKYRSKQEV